MRRRAIFLLLIVALALPVGAQGKGEITRLKVCGSSGCETVTDGAAVRGFMSAIRNGAPRRSAPAAEEYFTIRPKPTAKWKSTWPRYTYLPGARLIRIQWPRVAPEWRWLGRRDPLVRRVTQGLKPYPPASRGRPLPRRLEGTNQKDMLRGTAGNDFIKAGAGADRLWGFGGRDGLHGEDGGDVLYGGGGGDLLYGGRADDLLYPGGGRDSAEGGLGNDRIRGWAGDDILFGGPGDDHLSGGEGGDVLRGSGDEDFIDARDPMRTRHLADCLNEDGEPCEPVPPGADLAEGGGGNDRILTRDGRLDFLTCGSGFDIVIADERDRLVFRSEPAACERVLRAPFVRGSLEQTRSNEASSII